MRAQFTWLDSCDTVQVASLVLTRRLLRIKRQGLRRPQQTYVIPAYHQQTVLRSIATTWTTSYEALTIPLAPHKTLLVSTMCRCGISQSCVSYNAINHGYPCRLDCTHGLDTVTLVESGCTLRTHMGTRPLAILVSITLIQNHLHTSALTCANQCRHHQLHGSLAKQDGQVLLHRGEAWIRVLLKRSN